MASEMISIEKSVHLGDEFDEHLRQTLFMVLREMGAAFVGTTFGVAGSQEIESIETTIGGQSVKIEAETYVGLTVTTEETLAREIEKRVRARLSAS